MLSFVCGIIQILVSPAHRWPLGLVFATCLHLLVYFLFNFFFLASSTMINDYTYISHLFWFPPNFEKWKTPQPIPFCSPHLLVQPCPCCQNKNKKKIPRVRVRFLKDKKWDWTEENNSLSRNSHFNCFFFLTRENNYGTTFSAKKFLKSVKYID